MLPTQLWFKYWSLWLISLLSLALATTYHNPTSLGNTCILNIHLILSLETFCYCHSTKVKEIIACVENCIYEITNKIPKLNSLSLNNTAPTSQFIPVNVRLIDPVTLTKCMRDSLDSSHSLALYSNHKVFHFHSRILPFFCLGDCHGFLCALPIKSFLLLQSNYCQRDLSVSLCYAAASNISTPPSR